MAKASHPESTGVIMKKTRNKRIHVILVPRQYTKMKKLSDRTGYSISELMRRAVDLYLVKTDKDNTDT